MQPNNSFSAYWGLFFMCLLPTLFSNADQPFQLNDDISPAQKAKYQLSQTIFDDIVTTVRDYRNPPAFHFIYQDPADEPYYNAYYNPKNNGIYMSEALYDLAGEFKADSLNVLAMILGHELAHFYKGHGWGMSFGMANEDIKIAQKIYEQRYDSGRRQEMEAEADYFGGLFGYLAGYNTLKIGGPFFKRLYAAIGLSDTISGYPTLSERVKICENAQSELARHLPVFQAAEWSVVLGDYATASACYKHLLTVLPAREMYNNMGATMAIQAIQLCKAQELRYAYPFGLEMNTFLDTNFMGQRDAFVKIDTGFRGRLIKKSIEQFNLAIRMDENYIPAYINLALAQNLLGESAQASISADKAIQLATKAGGDSYLLANAQIAKGIACAALKNNKEAKSLWESALTGNSVYANANLEVLKDRQFARTLVRDVNTKSRVIFNIDYEYIENESLESMDALYDLRKDFAKVEMPSNNSETPSVTVYSQKEEKFTAFLLETKAELAPKANTLIFLLTNELYTGKTSKGIRLGSSLSELEVQYGKATHQLSGTSGLLLYYAVTNNPNTGMVFRLDAQQKVAQWGIYQRR